MDEDLKLADIRFDSKVDPQLNRIAEQLDGKNMFLIECFCCVPLFHNFEKGVWIWNHTKNLSLTSLHHTHSTRMYP